ncbi:unnamed protein product [Strongylus vulgaris]|uniref:Reverse transcriptase domain-containing protein n=1 Tax=Strongylus vulgaris TaxID=40348 RepID=A0A3P7IYW5_STRVU|nr:unnamed protein product [Strongylus vulgaris]
MCKPRQDSQKPFRITTGVHQRSVLSPLLFITVMDAVTAGLKRQSPWALLYADDVVLKQKTEKNFEKKQGDGRTD